MSSSTETGATDAGVDLDDDEPTRFPKLGERLLPQDGAVLRGSDLAIVCQRRRPCRLVRSQSAGRDESGHTMTVLEISFRAKGQGESRDPGGVFEPSCEPFEHWLVTHDAKGALSAEKLLDICNNGYGASGVGEDQIDVGPNRFSHRRKGGSEWRWMEYTELQLSPRRVLVQETAGSHVQLSNHSETRWSWETFSGWQQVYAPTCGPDGLTPEPFREDDPFGDRRDFVPVAALPLDFSNEGWKRTPLGRCALMVDGTVEHGQHVQGDHAGPEDRSFRVVGDRDGSFFVEVTDDQWVGPSQRWIDDDHLEVWVGQLDPMPLEYKPCWRPSDEGVQSWGVRLSDGAVYAAYRNADPRALAAEVVSDGAVIRAKLRPPRGKTITFLYHDADDGKARHGRLATSHWLYANALSLGFTYLVHPSDATCEVQNGALEPMLK